MKQLWGLWLVLFLAIPRNSLPAIASPITTTKFSADTTVSYDIWEHVNKTCLAHECDEAINMEHLRRMHRYMRPEAEPCENFHEYACGNWRREYSNGTTMMKYADDSLTEKYEQLFEEHLRERRHEQLEKDLTAPERVERLERSYRSEESDVVLEKMLNYYRVCKEQEQRGGITLRDYFEEMRASGKWHLHDFDWLRTLGELAQYGYGAHFMHSHVKQLNASMHRITVLPHTSGEHVNLTADVYAILREYTLKSRVDLDEDFRQLELDLERIVATENCDGNLVESKDLNEDEECDLMETLSFGELLTKIGEVNWQLFLSLPLGRDLRTTDLIAVEAVLTLKRIARYLNQIAGTDERDLLFLYTLARFLNYLEQQPRSLLSAGADGVNSRSCIRHMRKTLYLPMTYVYERAYYGRVRVDSDRVIRAVFARLKAVFSATLARNQMQLSSLAVGFLQKKLDSLRLNLGNLPLNASRDFYREFVRDLNISDNGASGGFYRNHLRALKHTYAYKRSRVDASAEAANVWRSFNYHSPDLPDNLDATPYYFCLSNMIIIPHAYLQTPFYDRRFWPALLYGDLANTLGHELLHAFDNNFIAYDYAGNPSEVYRLIEGNKQFQRSIACLEGTEFMEERIADISGTRLALDAFMQDASFRRHNAKLFFLQFAQFFCGAADLATFQTEDPDHDLDSLRLNYTLAHMPEFAEVFQCPVGSPMNPAKKCQMY